MSEQLLRNLGLDQTYFDHLVPLHTLSLSERHLRYVIGVEHMRRARMLNFGLFDVVALSK